MRISEIRIPARAYEKLNQRGVIDHAVAKQLERKLSFSENRVRALLGYPLSALHGIGNKRAKTIAKFGIKTVGALTLASASKVQKLGIIPEELHYEMRAALGLGELPIYLREWWTRSRRKVK